MQLLGAPGSPWPFKGWPWCNFKTVKGDVSPCSFLHPVFPYYMLFWDSEHFFSCFSQIFFSVFLLSKLLSLASPKPSSLCWCISEGEASGYFGNWFIHLIFWSFFLRCNLSVSNTLLSFLFFPKDRGVWSWVDKEQERKDIHLSL